MSESLQPQLDSLFVLRHAQREDKVSSTESSIGIAHSRTANEYVVSDTYNPGLATFQSTGNKSNNGYTQSMDMGQKILNYIGRQISTPVVVLKFHTSPYLRCVQTIKYMIDFIAKKHKDDSKRIKVVIYIDHFLSEWLNSELDINYYPPNDNGEALLSAAIQYLNSNLAFTSNDLVEVRLDLSDSYRHGQPGPYNESFLHQYTRMNTGLISLIKDTTLSLSTDPHQEQKEILLVMTHGAVVRSIISKLIGKSLFVEIPLASMSIAQPISEPDKKHYYWKLLETDIEIKSNITFNKVDIFSNSDPFQDIQLTFGTSGTNTHLSFPTNHESAAPNRFRSQSLLAPKLPHDQDSDSSSDSDNEGITFKAGRRRPQTTIPSTANSDHQKRFRSTSLFGPTLRNPFFSDDEYTPSSSSSASRNARPRTSAQRSKPTTEPGKVQLMTPRPRKSKISLHELIAPGQKSSDDYQNIDADDGNGIQQHSEYVPELAELSSSNSSLNSLSDSINHLSIFPGSFSTLNHQDGRDSTPTVSEYTLSKSGNSSVLTLEDTDNDIQQSTSHDDTNSKNSIFDRSLIEKSLSEMLTSETETAVTTTPSTESQEAKKKVLGDHVEPDSSNWMMSFGSTGRSKAASNSMNPNSAAKAKFKIDLYGKKNRYGLNLYDDEEEEEENAFSGFGGGFKNEGSSNGWFLGSNKY